MPSPNDRRERLWLPLFCVLAVVIGSMAFLWRYKQTPGLEGIAPAKWPSDAAVPRDPELPTLVMFVHPKCPCTRASLSELAELLANREAKVRAVILFAVPEGAVPTWARGEAYDTAARIAGARVQADVDEVEAHRFGAKTSGHVVLYGADGTLLFAGGITSARGHVGANQGRAAVEALIDRRPAPRHHPVFGCELDDGRRGIQ